jgi:hypothetical protein
MTGKRSTQVSVTILATLALTVVPTLAACRTNRAEALHCVDGENRVVDESYCRDKDRAGGTGFFPYFWYYGGAGRGLPNGSILTGGSYDPEPGRSYTSPGGTTRGGFGSSVGDGGSSGS